MMVMLVEVVTLVMRNKNKIINNSYNTSEFLETIGDEDSNKSYISKIFSNSIYYMYSTEYINIYLKMNLSISIN